MLFLESCVLKTSCFQTINTFMRFRLHNWISLWRHHESQLGFRAIYVKSSDVDEGALVVKKKSKTPYKVGFGRTNPYIGSLAKPYIGCPYPCPCPPIPMGFGWAWVRCYCSWVGMDFVHPCIQLQIGVKLLGCREYTNQDGEWPFIWRSGVMSRVKWSDTSHAQTPKIPPCTFTLPMDELT